MSKKVIIGAVATGVAALGVAVTTPASAKTFNTTISATGATAHAAATAAQQKCIDEAGSNDIEVRDITTSENADGSFVSTATCSYQKAATITTTATGATAHATATAAQQKCIDEAGSNDIDVLDITTSENTDGSFTATATCAI